MQVIWYNKYIRIEGVFVISKLNHFDQTYHDLLRRIMDTGIQKGDRTGTGTQSVFGHQMRFDLAAGFPLLTTKQVSFKLVATELLWFLRGDTNIRYLLEHNNNIWNEWAFEKYIASADYTGPDMTDFGRRAVTDAAFKADYDREMAAFKTRVLSDDAFSAQYGTLGNVYGKQWRDWVGPDGQSIDQIKNLIHGIKHNPDSRRHIVSAWNPAEIDSMALPPCHTLFQFYVSDGRLSLQLYQRSGDVFLGIPFNIASYSLLLMLVARECGLAPGEFVHTIGDAHIYSNHFDAVGTQLARTGYAPPALHIDTDHSLFDIEYEDLHITNYQHAGRISAPIAV